MEINVENEYEIENELWLDDITITVDTDHPKCDVANERAIGMVDTGKDKDGEATNKGEKNTTECSICLLCEPDDHGNLPEHIGCDCNAKFHPQCIEMWINTQRGRLGLVKGDDGKFRSRCSICKTVQTRYVVKQEGSFPVLSRCCDHDLGETMSQRRVREIAYVSIHALACTTSVLAFLFQGTMPSAVFTLLWFWSLIFLGIICAHVALDLIPSIWFFLSLFCFDVIMLIHGTIIGAWVFNSNGTVSINMEDTWVTKMYTSSILITNCFLNAKIIGYYAITPSRRTWRCGGGTHEDVRLVLKQE